MRVVTSFAVEGYDVARAERPGCCALGHRQRLERQQMLARITLQRHFRPVSAVHRVVHGQGFDGVVVFCFEAQHHLLDGCGLAVVPGKGECHLRGGILGKLDQEGVADAGKLTLMVDGHMPAPGAGDVEGPNQCFALRAHSRSLVVDDEPAIPRGPIGGGWSWSGLRCSAESGS